MKKHNFSWLSPKIKAGKNKKGRALFAESDIVKGERLIAFGGYIITTQQYLALPKNMLDIPIQVDDDLLFGAVKYSELEDVDYLNHSCSPNCGFVGQLMIVAIKNIKKSEEITIDYSMCLTDHIRMKCLCESPDCRKVITGNDWKNLKLQIKYKKYFQPYIKEKIRKLRKK